MNPEDLVATRYRLLRPIGRGAMGTVWAARHELLGREFALKFARVPRKTDPAARARFQQEAQLVGKLRHPNIVDVTDFGEVSPDGDFFLAMELLEGESLAERIAHRGHLAASEAVEIAADIAKGLSAVHAVGIVHRDVKPENIFLARTATGAEVPKLLDFGISRDWTDKQSSQPGALTGTPAYMSPEQANGETKLDPRTDIWSLGVVLYEMLTGKHPFVEPNYQALMVAIAEHPHVPLDATVPDAVRRVVDRCLAKRLEDRYANCDELVAALHVLDGRLPVVAQDEPRRSTRRTARWVLGSGLAGLALIVGIFSMVGYRSTPTEKVGAPSISVTQVVSSTSTAEPAHVQTATVVPTANVAPVTSATASAAPRATTRSTATSPQQKRVSTTVTTPGF